MSDHLDKNNFNGLKTVSQAVILQNRILELENQNQDLKNQLLHSMYLKDQMSELLTFEKMLTEISSIFVNLPSNYIDGAIMEGLERIGLFFKADRCNLTHYVKDADNIDIFHSWCREGVKPSPKYMKKASTYFPWIVHQLNQGKCIQIFSLEDLPHTAETDVINLRKAGTPSLIAVPVSVGGFLIGALSLDFLKSRQPISNELIHQLQRIGETFASAVFRKQKDLEIQKAFSEIRTLKEQIEADCVYLRKEIDLEYDSHNMIGKSKPFKDVLTSIQQIAPTNTTVLIFGETGTGKELVARAIHAASSRKERAMLKINCAALPANLIESELFGHEKGAFTGAQTKQKGRFELAHGSTLFLDEIGELPVESQSKLFRVLQEGELERLGSAKTIKVDVRIIAASNRNLEKEVRNGRFREDLWYRLNVFPLYIPPLHKRKEDIPLLVNHFIHNFAKKIGKKIESIPSDVMNALLNYHWPGNIRELENVIERSVVSTQGTILKIPNSFEPISVIREQEEEVKSSIPSFKEAERALLLKALDKTNWLIAGPRGAAVMLDINPSTLRYRMRKLGIKRQ